MTKTFLLSIIIIVKIHILSRIYGKPMNVIDESQDQYTSGTQDDLISILRNNTPSFLELLNVTELQDLLNDKGPFTIFAPTDNAIKSLEPNVLQALRENKMSKRVLLSHIVPGNYTLSTLTDGRPLISKSGISLLVNTKTNFTVNDVSVLSSDVMANNGVIHVIENFLPLTSGSENDDLQEMFHELLENLDINENTQLVEERDKPDLLGILKDKNLTRFQDLIEEAELLNTFTNKRGYPITVFAPTNEAFQNFDEKKLKEREYLKNLIFSHIVSGEVFSKKLSNDELLQSLGGSSLVVKTEPNLTINGHSILEDETLASNGVLFVVSRILTSKKKFTFTAKLPQWVRDYLPPPPKNKSASFPTSDTSIENLIVPPPRNKSAAFPTSDTSIEYLMDQLKDVGLNTTVDLIIKAGLDKNFSEEGPLTMFAPSNKAFTLMDSTRYETFLQNPTLLERLLLNHIINKRLLLSDLEDQEIYSLGGAVIRVENKTCQASYKKLLVSGVLIIEADLIGTNVVVHILNGVLFG